MKLICAFLFQYLVITNPLYLDSAALFRHTISTGVIELFLMFKQAGRSMDDWKTEAVADTFANQAIRKLLDEVKN